METRQKIGELLTSLGIVSQENLAAAMERQKKTGKRLGATLLEMNLLAPEDLEYLLGRQLNLPSINLANYSPSPELLNLIPEAFMRKNLVLPVQLENKVLTVAMANPRDLLLIDDLSYMTSYRIAPVVTGIRSLETKIEQLFDRPVDWEKTIQQEKETDIEILEADQGIRDEDLEEALQSAEEAPVIRLVNGIILAALDKGATHIHVEPRETDIEIFLRVDGKLKLLIKPPAKYRTHIVNRVKIISSIDVLKRFVPSEGYFRAKTGGKYYDINVSTIPSLHGERIVLAFQQPFSKEELRLEKLGFLPESLENFKRLITRPRGFIVVSGPADSGKSSTIYAALNHLKRPERALFTYERTIKNKLAGINQGQPNEKVGYSYERGLQALLKQDMDVLMVGELLTREAVVSALHASLTKTLVMGRMLSSNTLGTVLVMLEMGVPSFMVYSSLTAIVGQRLIRRLCQKCIEDYAPPGELADEIRALTGKMAPKLFRGKGCPDCGHTGYSGRIGLYEMVEPDLEFRDAILAGADANALKHAARSIHYRDFRQEGMIKAAEGLTSYEEVLRVL